MENNIQELDISYDNFLNIVETLSSNPYTIFFDSNRPTHPDNKFSVLCFNPIHIFEIKNNIIKIDNKESTKTNFIDVLEEFYTQNNLKPSNDLPFNGGLAGFFGYEYACQQSGYTPQTKEGYPFPDALFGLYNDFIIWDHTHQMAYGTSIIASPIRSSDHQKQYNIDWELSCQDINYADDINLIKEEINKGEFYQVNLTRRLSAPRPENFDSFVHYKKLRLFNSAPFSAYANFKQFDLLCHSPERFLKHENDIVSTKPIKGTSPSCEDKNILQNNPKERAENTMIVDMLRNDLSKNCKPHTVKVPKLCDIETFENIHHLVSTVTGEVQNGKTIFDILKSCLPGGSITGAPKLAAIKHIDKIESVQRGPYCGSLGYVSYNGNADFNIIIRSLIVTDNTISVHTGGGIVSDSNAQKELQETKDKIQKILESF